MGSEAGYSKAAGRRIAIWEAMNQQAAAQAAADAAKVQFEVPSTPEKAAAPTPTPTPTPASNTNQMSTEMLDKILTMVSDLSERFTKSEVGVEFAIDYLQAGKKVDTSLTKDVTTLASKIDKIADDLTVLSTRLDEILASDASEEVEKEPVEKPPAQNLAATQSTNNPTPATQNEQTNALDPRLAALTA